jgi:hypothetical protein
MELAPDSQASADLVIPTLNVQERERTFRFHPHEIGVVLKVSGRSADDFIETRLERAQDRNDLPPYAITGETWVGV